MLLRRLLFANFKRVYRLNQWLQQHLTANGMLILSIIPIAGVFGLNTQATLSSQIFSVTLSLSLIAMCYAFCFRGQFSINRNLPNHGTVDTPLHYACTIKNKTPKVMQTLILIDNLHDQFPTLNAFNNTRDPLDKKRNRIDRLIGYSRFVSIMQKLRGGLIDPINVDYIAENGTIKINVSLLPLRRGYLYFNKVNLAQIDPLGLFLAQKSFTKKDKLLILPKLYKTPKLNLHSKRTYQHGGINNAAVVSEHTQEFISLRDYHPSDPLRSIHWRSFAKHNRLIVKEYQDEFFIRHGLILDTFLANKAEKKFEDAISIAASFLATQQHDAVLDLMFINNKAYHFTAGGLTREMALFETLACMQPVDNPNIDELTLLIKQHLHEYSALICILLDLDEPRLNLLRTLSKFNLPMKVLLIRNNDESKNSKEITTFDIHIIRHGHLQSDLDKLT